jgi:amidase/6-aminohexanoate-cyclic-dimer hydrolase
MSDPTRRSAALLIAAGVAAATPAASRPRGSTADLFDGADLTGLAKLIRTRKISPREALDAAISACERTNPELNFIAQPLYDRARRQLEANPRPTGPFAGAPFLVKDLNTHIAGERTGQGSRLYADYRASATSEIVRRYEAAGLTIFGKTTSPEFGLTGTTESKAAGLTRNPWNRARSSGGSSGGAAAAVAARVVPAAHATDGGGSIRIPASCCGLFGLKPSRGRTPMGPPRTEGWGGLSAHHAVTVSVRDSAALLDAVAGPEPGGRYAAPTPTRSYVEEVSRPPGKLRVALWATPPAGTPIAAECRAAVDSAARLLQNLGHVVEDATPPLDFPAIGRASFVMIASSVAADVEDRAAELGVRADLDSIERVTLAFHDQGLTFKATDWARANVVMQTAAIKMAAFMERFDVILSPTIATPPPPLGLLGLSPDRLEDFFRAVTPFSPFTGIFNATGQPSMSLPLHQSEDGLPIGVMVSAAYGAEDLLFRLAGEIERAAPWAGRRPPG